MTSSPEKDLFEQTNDRIDALGDAITAWVSPGTAVTAMAFIAGLSLIARREWTTGSTVAALVVVMGIYSRRGARPVLPPTLLNLVRIYSVVCLALDLLLVVLTILTSPVLADTHPVSVRDWISMVTTAVGSVCVLIVASIARPEEVRDT